MTKVYDKGDFARISSVFRNIAGTLIDPTTVALRVTKPSGVTTEYTYALATVIRDSVGVFHVDVAVTEAGSWLYKWMSTGVGTAAEPGEFMVSPSDFTVTP